MEGEVAAKVLDPQTRLREEIDDANRLLEFAVTKGLAIPDEVVVQVKAAADWNVEGRFPPGELRSIFERAYRDLAQVTAPVTVATLRSTSDAPEDVRRSPLIARRPMSEAKLWSRKLGLITTLIVVLILFSENLLQVLVNFYPEQEGSAASLRRWQIWAFVFQSLEPFLYGALGAATYLLRSAHVFIYERTFDRLRIPEYYNRLLLGMVSGGAIKLFVTQVSGEDGQAIELSGAAVAFVAGYNSDFLFSVLERIAAAILPKVGVESMRRPGVDAQTLVATNKLLDRLPNASDDEKKLIARTLDRLLK